MFEAAVASMRFASSMLLGRRFDLRSVERIIAAMRETIEEFGVLGSESAELISGAALDEDTRKEIQTRRFRSMAQKAARETRFYADVFSRTGLDPARLGYDDISRVPLTPKDALRDDPDAFVARTASPAWRITTTGTTGRPTSVAFSHYELTLIAMLSSMAALTRGLITSEDVVHVAASRALISVHSVTRAANDAGALCHVAGVIDPTDCLSALSHRHGITGKKPRVSVLWTYPSYLGELVEHARVLGYGPQDFGLERILIGGEVVTDGLRRRAQAVFGEVEFVQSYAMTETVPFAGNLCSQGHLHYEPSLGMVETLPLDESGPDGLGRLVVTPFPPYRETTLLLRYDTEDLVRPLDAPADCELRNLPATTQILGKQRLAVRHDAGWTVPRDVGEALEALDVVPLPGRYAYTPAGDGVALEVLVRDDGAIARAQVGDALEERGVPVRRLRLVTHPEDFLSPPAPLRSDLREGSLTPATALPSLAGSVR